jgi:mono/diheme cytochrome c family protein
MRTILATFLVVFMTIAALSAVGLVYVRSTGLAARAEAGPFEVRLARAVRSFAVPRDVKSRPNPVPQTPEVIAEGLAHYADHCAVCHGNDGSGNTQVGQGTWPKAPDMRLEATQRLSDGELFYIIEEGVRFTGMPGWSAGTPEGATASWHLVHFIRHLPRMTPDEMDRMGALTPRSPDEIRQEIEAEQFLQGGVPPPPAHEH